MDSMGRKLVGAADNARTNVPPYWGLSDAAVVVAAGLVVVAGAAEVVAGVVLVVVEAGGEPQAVRTNAANKKNAGNENRILFLDTYPSLKKSRLPPHTMPGNR